MIFPIVESVWLSVEKKFTLNNRWFTIFCLLTIEKGRTDIFKTEMNVLLLTLFQMTNFRLFQTERLCRRQF